MAIKEERTGRRVAKRNRNTGPQARRFLTANEFDVMWNGRIIALEKLLRAAHTPARALEELMESEPGEAHVVYAIPFNKKKPLFFIVFMFDTEFDPFPTPQVGAIEMVDAALSLKIRVLKQFSDFLLARIYDFSIAAGRDDDLSAETLAACRALADENAFVTGMLKDIDAYRESKTTPTSTPPAERAMDRGLN